MSNETDQTTTTRRSRRARALGLLAGILAVVAVAPAGASAAVHVPTDAWMQYQPPNPSIGRGFLFGGFSTEKKSCEQRTIDIYRSQDQMNWDYIWAYFEVTGPNPGFTKYLEDADRGSYYTINVERKTIIKPNGKKIICEPGWMYDAVYAS